MNVGEHQHPGLFDHCQKVSVHFKILVLIPATLNFGIVALAYSLFWSIRIMLSKQWQALLVTRIVNWCLKSA